MAETLPSKRENEQETYSRSFISQWRNLRHSILGNWSPEEKRDQRERFQRVTSRHRYGKYSFCLLTETVFTTQPGTELNILELIPVFLDTTPNDIRVPLPPPGRVSTHNVP